MKDHAFSRVTVTVLGIIGAGFLTAVPSGRGVVNGFADTGNTYESVGQDDLHRSSRRTRAAFLSGPSSTAAR